MGIISQPKFNCLCRSKNFTPHFPNFIALLQPAKQIINSISLEKQIFKRRCSPFYGVTAQNPIEDGLLKNFEKCTLKSCSFNFKLDAQHAKQLKLLALPETGLVLVPRNWQDVQANAGANGTGFALAMSPDQNKR